MKKRLFLCALLLGSCQGAPKASVWDLATRAIQQKTDSSITELENRIGHAFLSLVLESSDPNQIKSDLKKLAAELRDKRKDISVMEANAREILSRLKATVQIK